MDSQPASPRTSSPQFQDSQSGPPPINRSDPDTGAIAYIVALLLGLFAGWVNEMVRDPLLTALCVVVFSMLMGAWRKRRPWRWMLIVWAGVPLTLAYYHFVAHTPHNRGQIYAVFLQLLAGSAGAHGGYFMRQMIDHVFLKQDD